MKISPNAQLKIWLGEDGNPEIYACGTQTEQLALCTALVAAVCMDGKDPTVLLINMMSSAADLIDRMEETHDET